MLNRFYIDMVKNAMSNFFIPQISGGGQSNQLIET